MTIISGLPSFRFCCFCIEQRLGAIIIAILEGIYIGGVLFENVRMLDKHSSSDLVYNVVIYAIGFLACILLLAGAIQRNGRWVAFYLYVKLFWLIFVIVGIVLAFMNKNTENAGILIANVVLAIYFWLCVNSYHTEIGG